MKAISRWVKAMRVLLINLATAPERLAFQRRQLASLGLAFERLDAVRADRLPDTFSEAYWDRWQRPLRSWERACTLSHRNAWLQVIESGAPTLILEDDAILSCRVPELLEVLKGRKDIDHVNLEVRRRKKLIDRQLEQLTSDVGLRRLYQDRSGSAAYVLWPSGARKLLKRIEKVPGLADALISSTYEMRSFQTDPACAVQVDRCADYGLPVPIEGHSSVLDEAAGIQIVKKRRRFPLRRSRSQLRLALRQIARMWVSERREIELHPADFPKMAA
jgi:glycosyl transferase family 25